MLISPSSKQCYGLTDIYLRMNTKDNQTRTLKVLENYVKTLQALRVLINFPDRRHYPK